MAPYEWIILACMAGSVAALLFIAFTLGRLVELRRFNRIDERIREEHERTSENMECSNEEIWT